ncbi:MAG: acyltransferase [Oscillospiraceae bacterium]|nr:acyltransferase [Oscillospiraceae bacterium]
MMCGKGRDGVAREGTDRDRRLDTVRSLAIIMVLVIHSAAAGLAGRAPGTADWWEALLWGAAARPAVPLFFLCSGALMLCRDISPKRLLTHNLPRIVCAMLVWAFLYRLARMAGEGITPAGLWDGMKRTLLLQHESHFTTSTYSCWCMPLFRWRGCLSGVPPAGTWSICWRCGLSRESCSPCCGISGPSSW